MSCLTRIDSYQSAEGRWQPLLSMSAADTLFITPQWQRVWWDQFGNGSEMLLLSFQTDRNVEGIAPLMRRNGTISLIGSEDLFDYNDFLVSRDAETRFYPCLLDHLAGEEWDTLDFSSLSEDSPTLKYLPDLAKAQGYGVEIREEDVVPGVALPATWDAYLQVLRKKDRHELRRKLRRLSSVEGGFAWYKVSDPDEVESSLEDFFRLMRYSREVKAHFLTEPRERFFRNVAREMADAGVVKLFFLDMGGTKAAAAMCFDYGQSRLLYNSGYDPEYRFYSVGLLLKAFSIKDAIDEGKAYFDFLRGAEPYKYDLGGKDRNLYKMVVTRN